MKINPLGASGLNVSAVCLGTMTFGRQNSEAEAHEQIDYAVAQGINFIDVAEMYPVPSTQETYGRSEEIVGNWLARQPRDQFILATKAAGGGRHVKWVRGGDLSFSRKGLTTAVEDSLRRLKTDYIDLYQLHWPERNTPMFGQFRFDPAKEHAWTPLPETLQTLGDLVKAGKIRHVGLSNETPWGLMSFLHLAKEQGLPRVVSVQNCYHLLNREWDKGMAEIGYRENVSLLAYSPLAFGHLSAKYIEDPKAQGRITLFPDFGQRYTRPNVAPAVKAYAELARANGLTPAQLALAFCYSRWFAASTIIGATTLAQLKENIGAQSVSLSGEVLKAIDDIHLRYTNPVH